MKKNYLGWIFIINLLFIACSTSKQISRLAKNDMLRNEAFTSAHTGISIYEPANQKYWYNYQGDKYFVPASNAKLPTCYAAMKYLGDSLAGLQYYQANDTLFISATADPTFLHPDFPDQRIFKLLKNTGKIIVLNTSLWQEKRWGSGWAWDDYNEDYMAERSAMPMYGNTARFSNKLKSIRVSPPYFSNKIIRDNIQNGDSTPTFVQREISSNIFFIKGTDPLPGSVEIPFYTADDSILLSLLKDTLHKTAYKNYLMNDKKNANEKEYYSQPTDSLLKLMMHRSDNFFAEQSLLMVSTKLLDVMNDEKIIDTLLKTDFKDLPQKPGWADGSGLSRYNLFTPQDFVVILNKMKTEFGMERIKNILPTGGTGTLSNYYKAESGYIFAKTGTLSGVVALSGFLYTKKNKLLIFSVMVNNHHNSATNIRRAVEKFIEEVRDKK
jgi:D-alanyl-D-alanine carboxypeptidase/D-alanyl-D-alanine-endopeptidase (penicillin-binding protein 4)